MRSFQKNKTMRLLGVGLIIAGWALYKLMVNVWGSTAWPGVLLLLLGIVLFFVSFWKHAAPGAPANKLLNTGIVILVLGALSFLSLLGSGFSGFLVLYTGYPLIVIGLVCILIAAFKKYH